MFEQTVIVFGQTVRALVRKAGGYPFDNFLAVNGLSFVFPKKVANNKPITLDSNLCPVYYTLHLVLIVCCLFYFL